MIPVYIKPYPDELMYSWIYRLAKANGLSLHSFYNTYLDLPSNPNDNLSYDPCDKFFPLYSQIKTPFDPQKLYLSVMTVAFESILMSRYSVERYVSNSFQQKSKLNSFTVSIVRNIYVCPECMKEDIEQYGEAYLHRAHHLSGVCVCHKHEIPLLEYRAATHHTEHDRAAMAGKPLTKYRGYAMDFNMDDYEEVTVDSSREAMVAYAKYANEILKAGVVTDSRKVNLTILSRMAEMGIDDEQFWDKLRQWKYIDLFKDNENLLKTFRFRKEYNTIELFLNLMFLFPNPVDAVAAIKEQGSNLKQYVCPDCGKVYCTASQNRWPCPDCTSHMSNEELFKLLVSVVGEDEYVPLTPFSGLKDKVLFLNVITGEQGFIAAHNFLYRGIRFGRTLPCEKELRWEQYYDIYLRYIAENGTGYVPYELLYRGVYLGRWLGTQRKLERRGTLLPDRKERLLSVAPELFSDEFFPEEKPWHKERSDRAWNNMFEACRRYIKQTGSFRIPHETIFEKRRIGEWATTQRGLYRKGLLSSERAQKLLGLDPDFFSYNAAARRAQEERTDYIENWEFKFDLLKQYARETGSVWVSNSTVYKKVHLGEWVCYLRARERNGKLSPERKAKLLEYDPDFFSPKVVKERALKNRCYKAKDQEWEKKRDLYKQYIEENGDPYIRYEDVYHDIYLGRWVGVQRGLNKKGTLSPERKQKLLELDPDFFDEKVWHERAAKHPRRYKDKRK